MECVICLEEYKKKDLNKCCRCDCYICKKCFSQLITIDTFGCCPNEDCIKNYLGSLFLNVICPTCRIHRSFLINEKTIRKYKIKLSDLIEKIQNYNTKITDTIINLNLADY